jgi:hypothetical protein
MSGLEVATGSIQLISVLLKLVHGLRTWRRDESLLKENLERELALWPENIEQLQRFRLPTRDQEAVNKRLLECQKILKLLEKRLWDLKERQNSLLPPFSGNNTAQIARLMNKMKDELENAR